MSFARIYMLGYQVSLQLQDVTFLNEFTLFLTLGQGSFGTVKLALNTRDNELYALKLLPRNKRRGAGITDPQVLHEIAVMKQLDHPNIVRLHEVIGESCEFSEGSPTS